MRSGFCRGCVALLLNLLNFLHAFVGVSAAIYSVWMLNRWIRHGGSLEIRDLPDIWFLCALMGVGVLFCLIALTGYVAAESRSSCCLCFFSALTTILILLEAALAGDLMLNKQWEQDLPYDSTGELKTLCAFIKENMDLCKWVALSVIFIQVFSLFLAMILRAMVPLRRIDYDSDEDFIVIRRPLLIAQAAPTYPTGSVESRGLHSDSWSSRMRQKYGLNQNEFSYNTFDPKASIPR
ncbi:tetraspanin-18-like [Ananas comosus]|uniref:Tetraspanin-18-like n=1 Tax=Ananas comosus TaxID=4615 RepID=A0A6P5HAY1_ANACO|nr:tetraspanin-18-like [Ananas comosus]